MLSNRFLGASLALLLLPVLTSSGQRLRLVRSGMRTDSDVAYRGRVRHALTAMQQGTAPFDRFRFRQTRSDLDRIERLRAGATDTVHVLCLRVEFMEDTTPLTTGNGKMDTLGFLAPDSGLLYDPPHFKRYFERQMEGVRNYFRAMSLGRLYVDFRVFPEDEKQCYQLPRQMQFYGDTTSYMGIEFGLVRLMRDALKVADEDPAINFADYDEFVIFHAGSGLQSDYAADGVSDSPYDLLAGEIPAGAIEAYLGEPYIRVDSGRTRIEQATVLPEMMRQDTMTDYGVTNLLGMTGLAGTLTHEFAHLLGAYDLYDVTGITMGVGGWSLMGYGGWLGDFSAGAPYGVIPGFLDAYHRVALGLVNPLVVRMPRESVLVCAAAMDTELFRLHSDTTTPTIIKVPITAREYFLIENRQTDVRKPDTIIVDTEDGVLIAVESNEYDFFQPGSGILIWHVDEGVLADYGPYNAVNINPAQKGVDLEEADGVQDFDVPYYLSYNPFYEVFGYKYDAFAKGGYNDSFSARTMPSSDGYAGKSFISVGLHGERRPEAPLTDSIVSLGIGWDLYQPGFPRDRGRFAQFLSAFACDIDRDDSVEVAVMDTTGQVSVWKEDGSGFRFSNGLFVNIGTSTRADVAIGDVAGDSLLEVVAAGNDGRVRVYSAAGTQLAVMATGDRVVAAPLLVDLNGDDRAEVVVGSTDMKLYAWTGTGGLLPGFPVYLGTEIRAAAAATSTSRSKIVVVTGDSRLFLVHPDGSVATGFPITLGNSPFYAQAQPVVADFDRDGEKEIAVVAGGEHDFRFHLIGMDGTIRYQSLEAIQQPFGGRLAAADINRDGYLDVLCASKFRTYAFNYNGTPVANYPLARESSYVVTELAGSWIITYDAPFLYRSSPVVADIDADGVNDLMVGSPVYGLLGFDGRAGTDRIFFPLMATASVSAVPLVVDVDRDGYLELAAGSDSGIFYVWKLPTPGATVVWSCAYHDAAHTGLIPDRELPAAPDADSVLVSSFFLYPNPAGEKVNARYRLGARTTSATLLVLNMSGDAVFGAVDGQAVAQSDNETTLDLKTLAPGLYVVRLEVKAGAMVSTKFAKLAIVR